MTWCYVDFRHEYVEQLKISSRKPIYDMYQMKEHNFKISKVLFLHFREGNSSQD